jgi:hypothetical protein
MDQVTELQETLKQKKMQLRAMETELQACKNYVHDIRLDLEHTKTQTERLERSYLARMSRV